MINKQYILLGPKGHFLIKQGLIIDLKANGNDLLKAVQNENFINPYSDKYFKNPYAYVVKKEKPELNDILQQELLKIKVFHNFSNHNYLCVNSGLEDLNATDQYFQNDAWKSTGVNVKYKRFQYIQCLNKLKQRWVKEKLGEYFYK